LVCVSHSTLRPRFFFFFLSAPSPSEIYPLSLHDALPISLGTLLGGWRIVHTMGSKITKLQPVGGMCAESAAASAIWGVTLAGIRSEEHTSELQSLRHLVCRLLLEKKKKKIQTNYRT